MSKLSFILQEKRRSKGLESGSDTEHEKPRKVQTGVRIQETGPSVRIPEQPVVIMDEKEALLLSPTVEERYETAPEEGEADHREVRPGNYLLS